MPQKLANLRSALYAVAALIGAAAVGHGIITQTQLALWLPIVPAVFMLVVAIINVKHSGEGVEMEPHPDVTAALGRIEETLSNPPTEPIARPAAETGRTEHPPAVEPEPLLNPQGKVIDTTEMGDYTPRHAS